MKEEKLKTELKLSKSQLQLVINDHLSEENGLHEVFEMFVNGLMYSEREAFLEKGELANNKGNGYRQVKKNGIGSKLSLQIPRDRLGVFRPVILGLLDQQEEQIKDLCFSLYGKGLTTRQIGTVLEDTYGKSYSKSTVSRITTEFYEFTQSWMNKKLDAYYPVVFIDAIHLKIRRDSVATEAFYIILGLKEDFTREVLGVMNLPNESASGWQDILKEIKTRGVQNIDLLVFDDLTGLDTAVGKEFPMAKQQKCILHFQRNLSRKVRKTDRAIFCKELSDVFDPDHKDYNSKQAVKKLRAFLLSWTKSYPSLIKIEQKNDLEVLFTYLQYDYRVRRMIYTTNWIERLNKSIRRTTKIRNALPTPMAALNLIAFVAIEMEENAYKYPIRNFKFEYQDVES